MRIVICIPGFRPDAWVAAFASELPDASIEVWSEELAPGADYAVVWSPTPRLFETQKALKAVFNLGAGVDALMRIANLPADVPVVRLGDAGMSVQMAEYVCQAVTRFARGLAAHEVEMREGRWNQRMPKRRSQFPVGVMGLGAIGERVARALVTFEYPVLGWSRSGHKIDGVKGFAGQAQLDDFLKGTRILVCALPLTPETTGILSRANLEKLLPDGYLINVGRGAHLVEKDLMALLDSGRLAGATLDVFQTEPLPAEHAIRRYASVTLTPHVSAVTILEDSVAQIAGKIMQLERGETIEGMVDRGRGY
jgi:glyoxylate/hydroxypyruvate reductase A